MADTPVCRISEVGCLRPTFDACLEYVKASYRSIYGADVYLEADSQDGQFMALLANAIHDSNGQTLAAYNAFSPANAQGVGLSSVVKINGIRRKRATFSTVDLLIVGQVGTQIIDGVVRDPSGNLWDVPDLVIPLSGQITVTATARTIGALALPAGALDTTAERGSIAAPQLGWQSARNPTAAIVGQPVETDTQLRRRQSFSTGLPAQTVLEGLVGSVMAVLGVTRLRAYENDSNLVDDNTVPAHAIALVIEGGDVGQLARVIAAKKPPGVGTYGDVLQTVTDAYGIPHPMRFFRPVLRPVTWAVTLRPRTGYTADSEEAIRAALVAHTDGLGIGNPMRLGEAWCAANLKGTPQEGRFEVVELQAQRSDRPSDAYGDVPCAFNEALTSSMDGIAITVLST